MNGCPTCEREVFDLEGDTVPLPVRTHQYVVKAAELQAWRMGYSLDALVTQAVLDYVREHSHRDHERFECPRCSADSVAVFEANCATEHVIYGCRCMSCGLSSYFKSESPTQALSQIRRFAWERR